MYLQITTQYGSLETWGSRSQGSQQACYIISLLLWRHDSCVKIKQSLPICENWPISAQSELTSASCSPSSFKYLLAAIWSGQTWARCQDYCRCTPLWTWGRDRVVGVVGTQHKQPIHEVTRNQITWQPTAYTEHMHSISPPRLLNGKCKPTHNKHIHHHYRTALVHAVRQWLPMATASTVALTMDARKSSLEERVCVKAGFLAESLWMYSSPNMMAQGEMLPSLLKENKTRKTVHFSYTMAQHWIMHFMQTTGMPLYRTYFVICAAYPALSWLFLLGATAR